MKKSYYLNTQTGELIIKRLKIFAYAYFKRDAKIFGYSVKWRDIKKYGRKYYDKQNGEIHEIA